MMKNSVKWTILAFVLCFCVKLNAEIIETATIRDVDNHIKANTLIIFDIDNTLMEPAQTIGSDQWFRYRITSYLNEGYEKGEALELALAEWEAAQNLTNVKVVEEGTAEYLKQLQRDGYTVMALTSRGLGMATRTIHQLKRLDIDFTATPPSQDEQLLMNSHGIIYRKGVLFTSGTHKGNALFKLLRRINHTPDNIVFVNDKLSHIKPVEHACAQEKVPFTGLRYSYLDEKVNNFSNDIADLQFEKFGNLISDDEASKLLTPSQAAR